MDSVSLLILKSQLVRAEQLSVAGPAWSRELDSSKMRSSHPFCGPQQQRQEADLVFYRKGYQRTVFPGKARKPQPDWNDSRDMPGPRGKKGQLEAEKLV